MFILRLSQGVFFSLFWFVGISVTYYPVSEVVTMSLLEMEY